MVKIFRNYPFKSAEYVVLHAQWAKQRGKNPSLTFLFEKDPRRALTLATRLAYFPVKDHMYLKDIILQDYKCSNCGASNCKLWRPYQTFNVQLLCAICAAASQKENIADIDNDGMRTGEYGKTDQIGWYIPAVPTEEVGGYWGYTSVPGPAVQWWKELPSLPDKNDSSGKTIPSRFAGRVKQFYEGTGDW